MEKKNVNYGLIIFIVIIVILFIPIIIDYIKKQNIEVLSSVEIIEKLDSDETFMVYVGDLDKSTKKELRNMRDMTKTDYSYEYDVVSTKKSDDIEEHFGEDVITAIIIEGELQKTYTKYDEDSLKKDVEKYFLGNLNEENRSYKVAENYNAYKKLVKSEEVTVAVFGRDTCYYCNKFKPVYNAVAEKYDINIYYFDSDNYNKDEYIKIINMNLTIPAKCNSNGVESKLADGFGTPLTLFTKDGKVIDCISGYVNRTNLISKLQTNNLISE